MLKKFVVVYTVLLWRCEKSRNEIFRKSTTIIWNMQIIKRFFIF